MAITATHLATSGSTTDGTSFATASIAPSANALILAAIHLGSSAAGPVISSVTGLGLTWVQVAVTGAATARDLYVFRALGPSPVAGPLTITTSASAGACMWSVAQFTGVDTSGTNGSGAIAGSVIASPASASSVNVALSPTPTAGNAIFGAIAPGATVTAMTAGSGFTLLGSTTISAPVNSLFTEYDVTDPLATAVTGSWTTAAVSRVVGVEVKAAPVAGGNLNGVRLGSAIAGLRVGAATPSAAYLGSVKVWP